MYRHELERLMAEERMRLRICDGRRERTVPASLELVEEAFTPAEISEGYEVALAEGDRWIAALAVSRLATGDPEFLLRGDGFETSAAGRVSRSEALRQFREFVLA
jgi:hypothetical protein